MRLMVGIIAGLILPLAMACSVAAASYSDVPSGYRYAAAIEGMAERGIIEGYSNGNFGPSDAVTRQQLAKMIVLTMGFTVTEQDFAHISGCPLPRFEPLPVPLRGRGY